MTRTVRAALISIFILCVGLAAVHLEVEHMRSGARIRALLQERDRGLERIRRLEVRYNRMVSPDVLQERLIEDFGPTEAPSSATAKAKTKSKAG
jgi:hypothetical protein